MPNIFFGSAGSDIGTWDSITQTLDPSGPLVLQLRGHQRLRWHQPNSSTFKANWFSHQLCPNRRTMTLFGLGIVGLFSYAWRARKRKA